MDPIAPRALINREQHAAACLGRLGLTAVDLAALAAQGFISAEYRSRGPRRYGPIFKLRWRLGNVQKVRYLGRNPVLAEQVQVALAVWQAPHRAQRESAALLRSARRTLRAAKAGAAPQLAREGRYLHGYAVRRRRHSGDHDDVSMIDSHGACEDPQV